MNQLLVSFAARYGNSVLQISGKKKKPQDLAPHSKENVCIFFSVESHAQLPGFLFLHGKKEKCLVVHSHPTPIPPLSTWINNVRDSRESIVGPYFFNNIIGPRRQGWDRSGMRVYNQAFLENM